MGILDRFRRPPQRYNPTDAPVITDGGQIGVATMPVATHGPTGGPERGRGESQTEPDLLATDAGVLGDPMHRVFRLLPDTGDVGPLPELFGGGQPEHAQPDGGTWTGVMNAGATVLPSIPEEHGPGFAGPEGHAIRQVGGDHFVDETVPSYAALSRGNTIMITNPRQVADGSPDGENTAGFPLTPDVYEPSPQRVANQPAGPNDVDVTTPMAETRAGRAEPDQGRPAHGHTWLFARPFDQWAAHRLTGQRGMFGSPHASTPVFTHQEAPGKAPAAGMDPSGPHPNTWRLMPTPWDREVVDAGNVATPDAGVRAVAAQRWAAWRAA